MKTLEQAIKTLEEAGYTVATTAVFYDEPQDEHTGIWIRCANTELAANNLEVQIRASVNGGDFNPIESLLGGGWNAQPYDSGTLHLYR